LEDYQVRMILDCLEERRDTALFKLDKVRKMKAALSDDLYNEVTRSQHEEIELITETIAALR